MGKELTRQLVETTLTMPEFLEVVEECVTDKKLAFSKKDSNHRGTPAIWIRSVPGIGKSQRIQGLAKKFGIGLRIIDCSHLQQGDLSGIPVQVTNKAGETILKRLAVDNMFPSPTIDGKNNPEYWSPGIVFFDEISSCPIEVRSELLSHCDGTKRVMMDGKENSLVPPYWLIIAAGNNAEYVGDNYAEFGYNVRCRFDTYDVIPDLDDFMGYMNSKKDDTYDCIGFHPMIIAYLRGNKNDLAPSPEYVNADNCANPRNWEILSDHMRCIDNMVHSNQVPKKEISRRVERKAFARLGNEVGNRFMKFFDNEKDMIPPEEIWKAPLGDKQKSYKEKSLNTKLLSIYRALDDYQFIVNGKKKDEKAQANRKTGYLNILDNVEFLFAAAPEEYIDSIFTDVMKRDTGITATKELSPKFKDKAIKSSLFNS